MTDASPDVWKTIRVWLSAINANQVPAHAKFFLVTTGIAPPASASAMLRLEGSRNESGARALLVSVAQSSTSEGNKEAYALFLALDQVKQLAFLSRVQVIDAAPRAHEIIDDLHHELRLVVPKNMVQHALEAIEGWWFGRVVRQLAAGFSSSAIASSEVEAKIDDVREQFKRDALPIDDDLLVYQLDEATRAIYEKYRFVRQVELVTQNGVRIKRAIADYFRAFQQRSRWLRKELLYVGDLEAYEQQLYDEWEICFAQVQEDLGKGASDEAKMTAGAAVLKWVESIDIPIRHGMQPSPWVSRGTLHLLSDGEKIGWHPDFKARLAELLRLDEVHP